MNDEQFAAILASMNGDQRAAVLAAVASTVWSITSMLTGPDTADVITDEATEGLADYLDTLIESHRRDA